MGLASELPSCAAAVPMFQVLPGAAIAELTAAMQHRRFAVGEVMAADGDLVEHLIVVAHGRAGLVHTSASGREQVVRELEPGEFWGEMALFAQATQEGNLVALEETAACLLPRHAVQSLIRRYPEVTLRLVESLAERIAEAERLIADLGLRDVGQRLAAELARLTGSGVAQADGGVLVRLPVSWAQLAVRLGTTPESISRRLAALAAQGLVRQKGRGREIVILSRERLLRMAER